MSDSTIPILRVIYVAGPFTGPTRWRVDENVREAERWGLRLVEAGMMPLIPHSNTRSFDGLATPEFWYAGTLELMHRCDGVLMMPSWRRSSGARAEEARARAAGLPVFYATEDTVQDDISAWGAALPGRHPYPRNFSRDTAYELDAEIGSARAKFPANRHMLAALTEEVGELAESLIDGQGREREQAEAVQVACVAVRLYEEGDGDFHTPERVQADAKAVAVAAALPTD